MIDRSFGLARLSLAAAPLLIALSTAGPAFGAVQESYVVLIDCSGSVAESYAQRAVSLASEFLQTRFGCEYAVVAFADHTETLLDFQVGRSLTGYRLDFQSQRKLTVLYDAIFDASKMLAQRKAPLRAILLFTDGRDYGSDLLLEDSVRMCLEQSIPVCAFGIGKRVNEQPLRRISKLTGGIFGDLPDDGAIQPLLNTLRKRLEPPAIAAAPAEAAPVTAPHAKPAAPPPTEQRERPLWPWIAGAVLAAALGGVLLIAAIRRKAQRICPNCGTAIESYLSECPNCASAAGASEAALPPPPQEYAAPIPADEPPPLPESEYPARVPGSETMDTTVVMLETPVLIVKKGKNLGAVYPVPWCGVLNIGRNRSNNIVLDDRTASGDHCRLKHDGEKFVLYDLKSTNGVFLNDEKVSQAYLKDGDALQIGETHFLFKVQRLSS
ncbi:MAG: FHA domain-containing protein [Acidobacteriota bacterium]